MNKVQLGTSRVGWMIVHGVDPYPLHVLHTCDNRRCCNPAHWFLGTNSENVQDMMVKGRHVSTNVKLSLEHIAEIKRLIELQVPQSRIAASFGVTQTCISKINCKATWKNL